MKRLRILSLALAVVMLLSVPAFAIGYRASDQLAIHTISISANPGEIYIYTSVTGTDTMNKIGCESIEIYRQVGSYWVTDYAYDEDDDHMSNTNSMFYTYSHSFNSIEGAYYMVEVTVFAEDDEGRDTRSKTVYLTGE